MKNKRFKSAFLFVPILIIGTFGASNLARAQVVGSNNSDNWAGYTSIGSGFTEVEGGWIVPRVIPTSSRGIEADTTWVGVGGVNNWNLIQAGTEAIVVNGLVEYHAWYELLPDVSKTTSLRVSPGDSVRVKISETSRDNWLIEITNNTTGESWSKTVYYASNNSSVEWIEEAPTHENSILPIDDFRTVNFTNASAVKNGQTYNANELPLHAMNLVDNSGEVLASPSNFISTSSFSVNSKLSLLAPATPVVTPVVTTTTTASASKPAATASVLPGTVHFTLAYVMPGQVYQTN
jgi:hypothetical protein